MTALRNTLTLPNANDVIITKLGHDAFIFRRLTELAGNGKSKNDVLNAAFVASSADAATPSDIKQLTTAALANYRPGDTP